MGWPGTPPIPPPRLAIEPPEKRAGGKKPTRAKAYLRIVLGRTHLLLTERTKGRLGSVGAMGFFIRTVSFLVCVMLGGL